MPIVTPVRCQPGTGASTEVGAFSLALRLLLGSGRGQDSLRRGAPGEDLIQEGGNSCCGNVMESRLQIGPIEMAGTRVGNDAGRSAGRSEDGTRYLFRCQPVLGSDLAGF